MCGQCSPVLERHAATFKGLLHQGSELKKRKRINPHPICCDFEKMKTEVEQERLGSYVIMPDSLECAFKTWWRSLPGDAVVKVRYPHSRHGNAGKTSHSAKSSVMQDFLLFVDINSQPNRRSADSSGPTHYFLPKFTTIQMPKAGTPHFEERAMRSVVGEFNRSQGEAGKGTCSNGSSHNWLKTHKPRVSICPHQEDYCDKCAKRQQVELSRRLSTA